MKIIGITGGIGSGKSKVLNFFSNKDIPCYNSDYQSKNLVNSDSKIKKEIKKHFGDKIYCSGELDSKALSKLVFSNSEYLKKLNSIVHPAVNNDFNKFIKNNNNSSLIFKESAILFESESYLLCDYIVLITAPVKIRVKRVIKRDLINVEQVKSKISSQWSDEKKSKLSNKIISNIKWNKTVLLLENLLIEIKNKFNITD